MFLSDLAPLLTLGYTFSQEMVPADLPESASLFSHRFKHDDGRKVHQITDTRLDEPVFSPRVVITGDEGRDLTSMWGPGPWHSTGKDTLQIACSRRFGCP